VVVDRHVLDGADFLAAAPTDPPAAPER
jgi:hypothetical protein